MAGSLFSHLKIVWLLCLTMTLAEETESSLKRRRRETSESEENVHSADGTKINNNRRSQQKKFRDFQNRRRCFLGSPFGCPGGFEDSFIGWPSPWGWGPGPQFPEYGPDFHRGCGGCENPSNHFGCGGPWQVPGCSCGCGCGSGCGNHGWCSCGGGGGGGSSDCPQFNDAPPSRLTPNKVQGPPQLRPFIGKQANLKGPLQMKQGKNINIQNGRKRQDIANCVPPYACGASQNTYSSAPSTYGSAPYTYGSAPYTYGSSPYTYGSAPYTYSSAPYTYGSAPYTYGSATNTYGYGSQATYGNEQQLSPDQVVGSLFFWKFPGQNGPTKKKDQNKNNDSNKKQNSKV